MGGRLSSDWGSIELVSLLVGERPEASTMQRTRILHSKEHVVNPFLHIVIHTLVLQGMPNFERKT